MIVRASNGSNATIDLIHDTSLYELKVVLPPNAQTINKDGLRIFDLPSALIHSGAVVFDKHPVNARTALAQITDASEVLSQLLDGGHSVVAGRLAGAFRNNNQSKIADDIVKTMKSVGYKISEHDPFQEQTIAFKLQTGQSPYVNRIRIMWDKMRKVVVQNFPPAPGLPRDVKQYLKQVDEIYTTDAYHSLSIEHYVVSQELIERVRSGDWDTIENEEDLRQKDAMAARGYWLASREVKSSIERVLSHENPGTVVDEDHSDWYRQLFAPSVTSGILKPSDLAGYRSQQVYIANARHVPPNYDAARQAMPELFRLLRDEPEPIVRAVLGHFIFVYIHPYRDGNGRMARFLMNVMLASGGYPWTVIPIEMRDEYMSALEEASSNKNVKLFASFIIKLVRAALEGKPFAKLKQ